MKKVNIYIAKRGRSEQLENCLWYLNEANKNKKYQVVVYLSYDDEFDLDKFILYENLSIVEIKTVLDYTYFNKARLLNKCIDVGNLVSFDWFQIIDLDMLYPLNYFELIENQINNGKDYVVCHGWKLEEGTQLKVDRRASFEELLQLPKVEFPVGPSQVAITKRGFDIIKQYFPEPLFDERFLGWGGEDSVLSSKSRILQIKGKLDKIEIPCVWLHQWHEERKGEGNPHYAANLDLYNKLNVEIMSKNIV